MRAVGSNYDASNVSITGGTISGNTVGNIAAISTGTYVPTFTSGVVIGTPTYSAAYAKIGPVVHVIITINCSIGNTFAAIAGSTYVNLPFLPTSGGSFTVTNGISIGILGLGIINTPNLYLGALSASTQNLIISGFYW